MFTAQTLTIEISGIMGAGFLPGLLQSIQATLLARYVRLLRSGERRPLVVRFHLDNTAAMRDNPAERDRVAALINQQPQPCSEAWNAIISALGHADRLFDRGVQSFRLPVDLAFRRGGLIQGYVLLNNREWLKIALDRPRAPNFVVFLTADLRTTEQSFQHDEELNATLDSDRQAYCATPLSAMEQQQQWAAAMRQIPGVINIQRNTLDKNVLASELIGHLRAPLVAHGCTLIEKTRVFISYATADEAFAARLHADLTKAGIPSWFAPRDVRPGLKIHQQLRDAIQASDRVLLILSPHSMASNWVKTEIAEARAREQREQTHVLFPLSLVPYAALREWQCFDPDTGLDSAREIRAYYIPDFSGWADASTYQWQFSRLLQGLEQRRGDGNADPRRSVDAGDI